MTKKQEDVISVVIDLLKHGAVEVEIQRHVFGTKLQVRGFTKCGSTRG